MTALTWAFTQAHSDEILNSGLHTLQSALPLQNNATSWKSPCNYLISYNGVAQYIGEADDANKRIKQQFSTTSTFYKNFIEKGGSAGIHEFNVQMIAVTIGRKEIEEFAIVNLETLLNKFQLNKRKQFIPSGDSEIWQKVQKKSLNLLQEADSEVEQQHFMPWAYQSPISAAGIYIVKNDNGKVIYIGESSNLYKRYKTHNKDTYFSALRKNIGRELFSFALCKRDGKKGKKHFIESEDKSVSEFLSNCSAVFYPINFGRKELESYLIKKHRPILNRKENKAN